MDDTMKTKLTIKVSVSVHAVVASIPGILWTLHEIGLL